MFLFGNIEETFAAILLTDLLIDSKVKSPVITKTFWTIYTQLTHIFAAMFIICIENPLRKANVSSRLIDNCPGCPDSEFGIF